MKGIKSIGSYVAAKYNKLSNTTKYILISFVLKVLCPAIIVGTFLLCYFTVNNWFDNQWYTNTFTFFGLLSGILLLPIGIFAVIVLFGGVGALKITPPVYLKVNGKLTCLQLSETASATNGIGLGLIIGLLKLILLIPFGIILFLIDLFVVLFTAKSNEKYESIKSDAIEKPTLLVCSGIILSILCLLVGMNNLIGNKLYEPTYKDFEVSVLTIKRDEYFVNNAVMEISVKSTNNKKRYSRLDIDYHIDYAKSGIALSGGYQLADSFWNDREYTYSFYVTHEEPDTSTLLSIGFNKLDIKITASYLTSKYGTVEYKNDQAILYMQKGIL